MKMEGRLLVFELHVSPVHEPLNRDSGTQSTQTILWSLVRVDGLLVYSTPHEK